MIPLIDIDPFLRGSAADKARTARALDDACREMGWLVIAGHGVPGALIEEMHAVSRAYFALPHWEKMKHKVPVDRYRGYTPPGDGKPRLQPRRGASDGSEGSLQHRAGGCG